MRPFSSGRSFMDGAGEEVYYCFACQARYNPQELTNCGGCGCLWPHEGDDDGTTQTLCGDCRRGIEEEELASRW